MQHTVFSLEHGAGELSHGADDINLAAFSDSHAIRRLEHAVRSQFLAVFEPPHGVFTSSKDVDLYELEDFSFSRTGFSLHHAVFEGNHLRLQESNAVRPLFLTVNDIAHVVCHRNRALCHFNPRVISISLSPASPP